MVVRLDTSSIRFEIHVIVLGVRNNQLLHQLDSDFLALQLFMHEHLRVVF